MNELAGFDQRQRVLTRLLSNRKIGQLVLAEAAELTGVDVRSLLDDDRRQSVSRIRHAVMWALREYGLSLSDVAAAVGRTDHTTAINGVKKANAIRSRDLGYRIFTAKLLIYAWQLGHKAVVMDVDQMLALEDARV